jgi:hypothetical protein
MAGNSVGADLSRPLPIYRLWVSSTDLANAPLSHPEKGRQNYGRV